METAIKQSFVEFVAKKLNFARFAITFFVLSVAFVDQMLRALRGLAAWMAARENY